jgi:hypothetical protein
MILLGGGAALVAVAWLTWKLWRGSRAAEMRRLAQSLGISRITAQRVQETGWFAHLDSSWPEGAIENAWSGEVSGAQVLLFERCPGGGSADPIALFEVAGSKAPAFDLSPRDGEPARGRGEVELSHGERFAEIYRLSCDDSTIGEKLFRPEVARFFERAENLDWRLTCDGSWLGITTWPLGQRSHRLNAKHVAAFFEDAKLVYRVLMGEPPRPRIGRS